MKHDKQKRTVIFDANDAPLSQNASQFLDGLQRRIGGDRGYGYPHAAGHWLRLRFVTKKKLEALVNLK